MHRWELKSKTNSADLSIFCSFLSLISTFSPDPAGNFRCNRLCCLTYQHMFLEEDTAVIAVNRLQAQTEAFFFMATSITLFLTFYALHAASLTEARLCSLEVMRGSQGLISFQCAFMVSQKCTALTKTTVFIETTCMKQDLN